MCLPGFRTAFQQNSLQSDLKASSNASHSCSVFDSTECSQFPQKKKKNVKEVQVGNQQSGNTNTFLIENYSFPHTGDKTSVVIKVTLQVFFSSLLCFLLNSVMTERTA